MSNVLQAERTKLLECEIDTASHMIPNGPGNADASRRTLGLESDRDIHGVAMQVSAIGNRVTEVDADAEPDGTIRWLVSVLDRNLLLHLDRAAYGSVDAVEYQEEGVAPRLNDPAVMLLDRSVDQVGTQGPQALKCPLVIQPDQTAVTHHVGVDHNDQFPPI